MNRIPSLIFLFTTIITLLFSSNTFAQPGSHYKPDPKAKELFDQAFMQFRRGNNDKAISLLQKAKEVDPLYTDAYLLSADIYNRLKNYELEKKEYLDLLEKDSNQYSALFNLANANYREGEFEEALENYKKLLKFPALPPNQKKVASERIAKLNTTINLMNNPVPFEPENMGKEINSEVFEYPPAFTVDGETVYFTRRKIRPGFTEEQARMRPGLYNEDIMVSYKKDGKWQPAQDAPGNINTDYNEGSIAISPDGSFMIFTACERPEGIGSCDLYISFLKNGKWTKPANMGEPVNSRFYESNATISFDGRTIYFTSNRPGTHGNLDLWTSTRDDNWNFSVPVNLGPKINTSENDHIPFIHPDDQTLYFVSMGHPGLGNNDIFYTRRDKQGKWDSVKNIGYPINTPGEESGLVVDRLGQYAYFSTTAENGFGGLDIWYFKLPEEAKPKAVTFLKGNVFDAGNKNPIMATYELADLATGKTIVQNTTFEDGKFLVAVPGGKDYLVNVSAKGYLFYSDNISLKNYSSTEPFVKDIPLEPLKTGSKITLRNIFFNTNSYELKQESKAELSRLISFMKNNPLLKIEISGHTDNTGAPAYNKDLSQKRAKAVYDYLINEGKIAAARLKYIGYGETQPVATNETEEGKAQNRRTEMKVIE